MAKHDAPKDSDAARAPSKPAPAFDPFATFTEWSSEADTAGYANL